MPPATPPAVDFQRVLDKEVEYIKKHRHPGRNDDEIRRTLVGLAMSGGGIRSATTNLGILQALVRMRILPMVDYVCTVSGGGYIGGCMSALLSWNSKVNPTSVDPRAAFTFGPDERPAFSTAPGNFPFHPDYSPGPQVPPPGNDAINPRAANGIIAHLRTHGNFLIAHRGLFRRESLRGLGALTIGAVYNAAGFLLMLVAAAAIFVALALALSPDLPTVLSTPVAVVAPDTVRHALAAGDSSISRTRQGTDPCPAGTAGCAVVTTTALHPVSLVDRLKRNTNVVVMAFKNPQPLFVALLLGAIACIFITTGISNRLMRYLRGRAALAPPDAGDSVEDKFERDVLQWATWALFGAVVVTSILGRIFWNRLFVPADEIIWLFVPFAAVTGAWLIIFIAVTVVLPLLDNWTRRIRSLTSAFYSIVSWGWWITLLFALAPILIYALHGRPGTIGLSAVVSLAASRFLSGRTSGTRRFSISSGSTRILLGLFVFLVILLGMLFFAAQLTMYVDTPLASAAVALGSLAIIGLFGFLANHNKLGPQYFYRDRLSETYLFSELPDYEGRLRVFHDAMEMPLDTLHGTCKKPDSTWRNPAPYHLISAAINLAGSRDLTRKDRKSGYWLFSRLFCGSTHTGFRETTDYRGGNTRLANALSISGAAASSGIGKDTFFAQAFATVLFNLRLGSWLENPAHESSIERNERSVFWPSYLFREAFMSTNESSPLVNLSDGGHTGDNVGIYPLLQRRCKIIIACDAERDPAMTFGSFTEALRHAYIDMGIDVDIDLTMIRPDLKTGLTRSHCAVGRIHYPDRPDQESILIYIKNSLMGDEPEPVLNYKIKCPDFPHESTVDQFFDDAQFESYRALGVHIAEHTFGSWSRLPEFETARTYHSAEA